MTRSRPWRSLFAGLFLATPGLAGQPAESPPAATQPAETQPAQAQPAAPTGPPVVTLVEAGSEPHQPLRFRPKVGATQAIEMTARIEMAQSMGGMAMPSQKAPTMRYAMQTTITAADEAGDISYAFEYTSAEVLDEPGVNPLVADMMRNALKAIQGLRGTGVMTDQGFAKLARFERPPDMDPMLLEQIGEMERSMEQLVSPFPAEPVGVGAVWKIQSATEQQGILIRQTATVHLVAVDEGRVELRMEVSQRADPQKIEAPGMPPMNLKAFKADGTTTSVLRLDQLFPEASTTNLTNDTTILIEQFGGPQELQQHTKLHSETKTK
jgi:hypothetical protein